MPRRLINQNHLPVKRAFVRQLRKEYNAGTALWDCFLAYLGMLNVLGAEYLTDMSEWQEVDYRAAIEGHKTMWHRNRRAGKTLGLTNIAVFFAILDFGYRANKGKVVWRAPANDQLEQAQEWLAQNPFVVNIDHENNVRVLLSKPIDMACLSAGKAASKGAAVMIEDEYRDVPKGYKIYDIAGRAEDMVAEGPNSLRRMISASTGCRLTYFHDQFLSGEWDYHRHTWKECPWIEEEYIESKRREHPEDPYFVQQEFESIWVARGDTAYRNVYIVDTVQRTVAHNENVYNFGDHPFFPLHYSLPSPRKAGVDFNDSAGHYIVMGSMDDDAIYVNAEQVVTTVAELKPYGELYNMEIESGPFEINIQNALKCAAANVNCIHQVWGKDILAERFRLSMDKMIVVDRRKAPYTLKNLQEAVFDENARESKLKKRSDQHGLDGMLHMIHKTNFVIFHSRIETNLDFEDIGDFGCVV